MRGAPGLLLLRPSTPLQLLLTSTTATRPLARRPRPQPVLARTPSPECTQRETNRFRGLALIALVYSHQRKEHFAVPQGVFGNLSLAAKQTLVLIFTHLHPEIVQKQKPEAVSRFKWTQNRVEFDFYL